jgi:predicted neutral ceramidase superfamily lipid hydrolase
MADPRTRALSVDLTLGVAAVTFGAFAGGLPLSVDGLLIAGTGLFVFVTVLYVAEHTAVLTLINRTRPMSLVLACGMFTAVGVVLIVGQIAVRTPSATLLFGMGVGFLSYRVRFGVIEPLPTRRLEQAEMWGSPPER